MSFSQTVKKEIIKNDLTRPCCVSAACYGAACFAKQFDTNGVVIHTEQSYIANRIKALYAEAGIKGQVYVRKSAKNSYEFSVKDPFEAEKTLAMFSHTGQEPSLRIRGENFICSKCFSSFLSVAFLCSGVIGDPSKGYVLEFVSPRYSLVKDFLSLIQEHGFTPGHATRKGRNVVYFKASEQIEDMLTTMGAQNAALEIINLKIFKDFRNKANRITNCETANIDKTVAATQKILYAIEFLEENGVLETMSEPLRQAAKLKREYPDYSLAELALQSDAPVSKSGLSHRYRKLVDKATTLKATMQEKQT